MVRVKLRPPLSSAAFTLPARFYTDAAVFAREQEIFFRAMWMCVGRLDDLPTLGSYLVRSVAGDSIVIVNSGVPVDAGGPPVISAFHNVCRHRGTTLCTETHGQLNGSIQCPYHAWTYGYDGALLGAPHMDSTEGFHKDSFPLKSVRAGIWDGFIWVNTSNDGPPLEEQLADLPAKFAPWRMGELRRGAGLEYDIPANWKLIFQNFSECLHCPNLHPALNKLSHYLSGENEPLQPTYMGGRMDLAPGVESMSMDGKRVCAYLPSLDEDKKKQVYYYAIFPNLLISAHPDYVMVHTLWPIAANRTRLVCDFLFHASESPKELSNILDFWDMTNKQDWFVCELAQQGISSRGYTPGPYSNREELLYAFDQFIVNRLKAFRDV